MRNASAHVLSAFAILAASGCCSYSYEQASSPGQPSAASDPSIASEPSGLSQQVEVAEQPPLNPNLFLGTWTGRGCQSDGPCWTIRVELSADEAGRPTGTIEYPSVPCDARLEFSQWEVGQVAAFRERFQERGKCIPDGWLRLRLLDTDKLGFEWAYPDGRVDAGTTLERSR